MHTGSTVIDLQYLSTYRFLVVMCRMLLSFHFSLRPGLVRTFDIGSAVPVPCTWQRDAVGGGRPVSPCWMRCDAMPCRCYVPERARTISPSAALGHGWKKTKYPRVGFVRSWKSKAKRLSGRSKWTPGDSLHQWWWTGGAPPHTS